MTKRVCLITGAGGTLGNAFCQRYREKYDIVAVCRRRVPEVPSQLQEYRDPLASTAMRSDGQDPVFVIHADLTEPASLLRIAELTLARFGRIDLLVNAAVHSLWAPIMDGERLVDSAELQFQMNVVVPLRLSALVARLFWRDRHEENISHRRHVVNVSSTAGLYIYKDSGQTVYSASKAALNYATLHMANEFRSFGVRANVVAPNSFPRLVRTEAVADAIVRLDDDEMTGQTLILDRDGERIAS
jgi:NAD(P)-dependent dehydrogenase (short-subunit alcohol dehydrogenase family)